MAYNEATADRLRAALRDTPGLSERQMFGGLCLMVDGKMFAGIVGDDLMLRVGPERFEELLVRPAARLMDFTGRPMTGFLYVGPAGFTADADLDAWLSYARDFVASLPTKPTGGRTRRGHARRARRAV
jgi:TfoX/Sxy family transcriptional regulator of competence genes